MHTLVLSEKDVRKERRMKKYVYFYHTVGYESDGERVARHGVVSISYKIDTPEKYLTFCELVKAAFAREFEKGAQKVKECEITTLQFLHEVVE